MSGGDIECAFAQTQVDCNALYTLETECNNQASCERRGLSKSYGEHSTRGETAFNDYLASTTLRKKTKLMQSLHGVTPLLLRKMHG